MSPKTTLFISVITLLVSLATLGIVLKMQERLAHLEANAGTLSDEIILFGAGAKTCKTDADCPVTDTGTATECLDGICQTKPPWWNILNDGVCLCDDGTIRHKQGKSDSCVDLCAKQPGS